VACDICYVACGFGNCLVTCCLGLLAISLGIGAPTCDVCCISCDLWHVAGSFLLVARDVWLWLLTRNQKCVSCCFWHKVHNLRQVVLRMWLVVCGLWHVQ
jgi:hypothetical protein